MGSRYLGGYIGALTSQATRIGEKMEDSLFGIKALVGLVRWNPQASYMACRSPSSRSGISCSAPPREWGGDFTLTEKALCEDFLLVLFLRV